MNARSISKRPVHPFDNVNHYVGFLGRHPDAVTPNLNRLAERSVVFERTYCQAPIRNPSRASPMSGMRPSTTGVYGNCQPLRFSEEGQSCVTLPQHFRENGYYATGSGRVCHSKFSDPLTRDSYSPSPFKQTPSPASYAHPLNGMVDIGNVDWGALDIRDEEMTDHKAVDYCLEQLRKDHDRPFFLTCGQTVTHLTWATPCSYNERFDPSAIRQLEVQEDDLEDVSSVGRRWANTEARARLRSDDTKTMVPTSCTCSVCCT